MTLFLRGLVLLPLLLGCAAAGPAPDGGAAGLALPSGLVPRFVGQTSNGNLFVVAGERVFASKDGVEPLVQVPWRAATPDADAAIATFGIARDVGWLLTISKGAGRIVRLTGGEAELEHTLGAVSGPVSAYRGALAIGSTVYQRSGGYAGTWAPTSAPADFQVSGLVDNAVDLVGFGLNASNELRLGIGGATGGNWPVDVRTLDGGTGLAVQCGGPRPGGGFQVLLGADPMAGPTHLFEGTAWDGTLTPVSQFRSSGPCLGGPSLLGNPVFAFSRRLFVKTDESFAGKTIERHTLTAVSQHVFPNQQRWAAGSLADGTPAVFPLPDE